MSIDIIQQENDNTVIKIGRKVVKCKTIMLCEYCHGVNKSLMKCSGRDCDLNICKNCATFIKHKPFCSDCIAKFIRDDALIIITKREGTI